MITEIREPNYTVDLPGAWQQAENADPTTLVYRNEAGDESLSITLLGVKPVYAIADRRRLLEDYLHHRTRYEQAQYPMLMQSETTLWEQENPCVGEWAADELGTGRRLRHRVVLVGSLLADFMFEATGIDEAVFLSDATATLGSVTVSE